MTVSSSLPSPRQEEEGPAALLDVMDRELATYGREDPPEQVESQRPMEATGGHQQTTFYHPR